MLNGVGSHPDFVGMEEKLLDHWYRTGIVEKYLHRNDNSKTQFSFLDGPITANNPMGVHHGRGRTYKDLWQRYHNMLGEKGRFRNGFDCQGLWVEVEVEKELGFRSKKDILDYGIENFVNKCKERVLKYAEIQTEQSKRLGMFMDWKNSYFTMSDENNYWIWHFLKICHERGWIYKGNDSVPWCPRCETAISQHEMLTEDYKEVVHESITMEFPIVGREREFLLVWTTTPWTIPGNIAVAVDRRKDYSLVAGAFNPKDKFWVAASLIDKIFEGKQGKIIKTVKGKELVGLRYRSVFDGLQSVEKARKESADKFHIVVATDDLIMPISMDEGTGLVHTAVSAGTEDFKLGQKLELPMIPIIADNADYLSGLGEFSGKNAKKNPRIILDYMEKREKDEGIWVFKIFSYRHRYPACWRCKTELVWKVTDEWYVAMDKPWPNLRLKIKNLKLQKQKEGKTLRELCIETAGKIKWIPGFGKERELDWLKNMHDWLISKKNRYWGLALPIWECQKCGSFEIIDSKEELKEKAVAGWEKFAGHTPHKPWIDEVKIKCAKCGEMISRVEPVGNPWLDAGIVSLSTMPESYFPADFVTECFPGQFKNWFYSLIVMATVLRNTNPMKTLLGYETVVGEDGRPMHKSWGNAVEFNEGASKVGVDVMRWMYAKAPPTMILPFGYKTADEVRRRFLLILWNSYRFFVEMASASGWKPAGNKQETINNKHVLDRWILLRLEELVKTITDNLNKYQAASAAEAVEIFVNDFSTWYIRRSRDRAGSEVYETMHRVLITLAKLMAPIMPYISDSIYVNLTGEESVHLAEWPLRKSNEQKVESNEKLIEQMRLVREIASLGHAQRKEAQIKLRQPLSEVMMYGKDVELMEDLQELLREELNVKKITIKTGEELKVKLITELTPELKEEGWARDLVRSIQEMRKKAGTKLGEKIIVSLPDWPKKFESEIKKAVLAERIEKTDKAKIVILSPA